MVPRGEAEIRVLTAEGTDYCHSPLPTASVPCCQALDRDQNLNHFLSLLSHNIYPAKGKTLLFTGQGTVLKKKNKNLENQCNMRKCLFLLIISMTTVSRKNKMWGTCYRSLFYDDWKRQKRARIPIFSCRACPQMTEYLSITPCLVKFQLPLQCSDYLSNVPLAEDQPFNIQAFCSIFKFQFIAEVFMRISSW